MSAQAKEVILRLVEAVAAKEPSANLHSRLVARVAVTLAKELGLPEDHVAMIENAAFLHDVGKLEVDAHILTKPTRLTPEEFEQIKRHPEAGAKIVRTIPDLKDSADAILHHHERWDGRGYPFGKSKTDTPLEGRILGVAETFASLTQDLPFRQAMDLGDAVMRLQWAKNTHLDPNLVEAFLAALRKLLMQEDLLAVKETVSLEELVATEVEGLRRAFIAITQPVLWGFERLVGKKLFEEFQHQVNDFFNRHRLPLQLDRGKVIDRSEWRSSPTELADNYRIAFAHIVGSIRKLLGKEYIRDWLTAVLESFPEPQREVCDTYHLCESFL